MIFLCQSNLFLFFFFHVFFCMFLLDKLTKFQFNLLYCVPIFIGIKAKLNFIVLK